MCDYSANPGGREAAMVEAHPGVWCDPCIAPFVKALNEADQPTVASCCGHGAQPGKIALADGRELFILPDFESARRFEAAHSEMETLRRFKPKPAFQSPAGEVERLRERLTGQAAIHALYCHAPTITTDDDAGPNDSEEAELRKVLSAVAAAVLPPPSDSQGDQERCTCGNWYYDAPCECEKSRCETCGGTGWKVVREGHDPVRRPCPDCNPAPTQPGKTQPRTPNKDPVRTEKPAPTQVEGDECERCKGSGQIEDAVGGDLIGMEMIACPACNGTGKRQPEGGDEDSDRLIVTENEATNERRYRCSACSIEFMVPLDDVLLPAERECDGCNRMLPTALEGGDEEDWPEITMIRAKGQTGAGNVFGGTLATTSDRLRKNREFRRYVPASQDSSAPGGLEDQKKRADHLAWLLKGERDRASKAEAERERVREALGKRIAYWRSEAKSGRELADRSIDPEGARTYRIRAANYEWVADGLEHDLATLDNQEAQG